MEKKRLLQLIPQKYKGSLETLLNNQMATSLEETNKFLDIYNSPKQNYEDTVDLNRPIVSNAMSQ